MNSSILLLAGSLFYLVLIMVIYFSKKRIDLLENKIYNVMLFANLFGILLDISGIYAHINLPDTSIIRWMIVKFYYIYLLSYIMLFTLYIVISGLTQLNNHNKINTVIKLFAMLFIIFSCISFLLPFEYYNDPISKHIYVFGPNSTFLYAVSGIFIIYSVIYIIFNLKRINKKKYIPMFAFIIIGIPIIALQFIFPELLLMTSLETFILILMYFTIENPDLKMIQELNMARNQAEQANNAKTEFLSSMSHEIRTPLNAIVGFSQALMEEDVTDTAKEEIKDIMMASDSLLEIVNGILDISKIEANKIEIINMEYNIKDILDNLVALTKTRIGEKPIDFRVSFASDIPEVLYGDHTRIKQVILNLLTNAAKYTKKGFIEFKVNSAVVNGICRLIISVEDTGIGIKQEDIDKLFSKFERLDLEQNITIEGTGLGLAITKRLIEMMHGKIVVQSIYGQGSKFTIFLDQKVVAQKDEKKDIKPIEEQLTFENKKVLLVDDNTLNLKVASRLLKDYKVNVDTATSGFECIEKINLGIHYDIILCDDMMPKMSGVETLKKLKENPDFKIPVIALTANAIAGMREKYLAEGFNDYLSKPIEKTELKKIIVKYLNN